ncbi:hypothetical protein [Leeuwenhoekiella marinoflava]|uniref:hypothetical protein n=1 Tax=Leeuwenhoekiella marinoflava TaxID=988 RepID=UPI0030016F84
MMGWESAAFSDQIGEFFWVYILAPSVGTVIAALFFIKTVEPAMHDKASQQL